MDYKIEVNEKYSIVDELSHRIKAIEAGDGVITVTAGKFTKSFNLTVVDRLFVDLDAKIGEIVDTEITTVDKITLDGAYNFGNSFEFMFEGLPFEIEASSLMGENTDDIEISMQPQLEPITLMGENTDDSMIEYDEDI